MAAATISIEQEQFCCPVCLEVLREPVTIPCGHSYCLACIEDFWGPHGGPHRGPHRGQYSCPQCRQVFNPRPLLSRNTVLGEVVDKFLQSGSQARVHQVKFGGDSGGSPADLDARRCPLHRGPLERYCRTDRVCVCSRCVRGRHRNHDTVALEEQRAAQQKKLQEASLKSEQRLRDVEKELRYVVRYVKHSAEAAAEESERIFSKLIRSVEKRSEQAKELIRLQEEVAVGQAEKLLEKLQREMAELRRADGALKSLSGSEDHVKFLQECEALRFPAPALETPNTDMLPYVMYKSIRETLKDLRPHLDETLDRELSRISDKVLSLKETSKESTLEKDSAPDLPCAPEPKTRADFLQYCSDVSLDPSTANPYLSFSDGGRQVTTRSEPQPYPEHPARFTGWAQVLCRAGVAGRCYWEVEWRGAKGVSVGVCYRSMSRGGSGSDSKLGHNSKSWSLDCSYASCSFQHSRESVAIRSACSSRVGVYLDFRAGTLSFYNVSTTMVLLHRVRARFSQPVYPGFWVGLGSSLRLCSL